MISFPYYETKTPGTLPKASKKEPIFGDIMLCPAYVDEDLTNWPGQMLEERIVLLCPQYLPSFGYDHETDADYAVMSREEKRLMDILKSM